VSSQRPQQGFTLIEVIVVMAILAILAAIAIPNYTEYVQRGRRADAKTALLQIAQWQERRRTETNAYATTDADIPVALRTVPSTGTTLYNITVGTGTAPYILTATRAGPMAADPCGNFTLTGLGIRGTAGGTRTSDECWAR
jgi:type IV pilus assembly protein PilE